MGELDDDDNFEDDITVPVHVVLYTMQTHDVLLSICSCPLLGADRVSVHERMFVQIDSPRQDCVPVY